MIIRQSIKCGICDQVHITRTGLGRSDRQEHIFACSNCKQEIGFTLRLDQAQGGIAYESWTNCSSTKDTPKGAPVVNLEADFLIPADMQNVDGAFPRLGQYAEIINAREAAGTIHFTDQLLEGARSGDARGEWSDLRQAWLLTRSGQGALARARVKAGSKTYYGDDPLDGLGDWLFRFNGLVGGEPVQAMVKGAAALLLPASKTGRLEPLLEHYAAEMASQRGRRYLAVFNEFFSGYDDFNQLRARLAAGLDISDALEVSSTQFDRTRMFYGNAFEALGSLVDLIAFANNVLQGREWSVFERLTVKQYLALDKSARFNAFGGVADLAAFALEGDNQLRNASHHGSMDIDPVTKVVTYQAGKGGQGEIMTMTYTRYLERCVVLFGQLLALLNVELLLTQNRKAAPF